MNSRITTSIAADAATALAALRIAGEWPAHAIEVGRVLGAWGVKGWVKLQAFSVEPEALLSARRWFVLPAERGAKVFDGALQLEVEQVRVHSDVLVARLAGVDDRDVAEALKGVRIFLLREDFPELGGEDEYYWVDLIGLAVVNLQGLALGTIRELLSNGPQSVLVVESPLPPQPDEGAPRAAGADRRNKPQEMLIPFVDAYVVKVSLAERRIVVDWQPDY